METFDDGDKHGNPGRDECLGSIIVRHFTIYYIEWVLSVDAVVAEGKAVD